ncbi:MAG TPA: transposase [Acidobacteriaceae bacterium]|nr:transposase [Acidobacteriaceae bacterium]
MGRDRFDRKVGRKFDSKPDTLERVEVIAGAGRRRRWPLDVKARIVMESLEDGAVICEVARRHGIRPQQLFAWRKQVRDHVPTASFAPVVVEAAMPALPSPQPHANGAAAAEIEIAIGMVVISVRGPTDVKTLTAVLRAVKAAA